MRPRASCFPLIVVLCSALSISCERNASVKAKPGVVHAEACSDVDVTTGVLDGEWLVEDESENAAPNRSISASDIAVASDGSFFIVDAREQRVTHLDAHGVTLRQWGRKGDGPGEFRQPRAIAIGPDRRVYVGDQGGRVSVFTPDGVHIRTFGTTGFWNLSGLVVLPNGNLVMAAEAWPREAHGAYVRLADSSGEPIRDLLSMSREGARHARPLLAPMFNPVRLTLGPKGEFAVWYALDNYVELFDASGAALGRIEGCLPAKLKDSYARAALEDGERQATYTITLGVGFDSAGRIRVASFDEKQIGEKLWKQTLRLRRYGRDAKELDARDFDISDRRSPYDRYVFVGNSELLAFTEHTAESGIRRVRPR